MFPCMLCFVMFCMFCVYIVCIYMYIYLYVYLYVCIYIYMFHVYVYLYVCIYICIFICASLCVCFGTNFCLYKSYIFNCLSCRYLGCYLLVWHCYLGSILALSFEIVKLVEYNHWHKVKYSGNKNQPR